MSQSENPVSGLRTIGAFLNQRACPDTLFHVLNNVAFDHPLKDEERAAVPLAGGILQHGYQCGMIWGAALAAGAQAFRLFGPGARGERAAILAARRLVESFRELNRHVNCNDITGVDRSSTPVELTTYFLLKGGSIGCFRMAARYAPVAFHDINVSLAAETDESPAVPASCAALVAQRMGATELHRAMVAGLAGGIGLSGGGCGALGAAIWLNAVAEVRQKGAGGDHQDHEAMALVARFAAATAGEFECARITGRQFGSPGEHAAWLRDGGCARLIDLLAND